MPKITRKADTPYTGRDEDGDQDFTLEPGESIEVSEAKARQLREDFPDDFDVAGAAKSRTARETPAKGTGAKRRTASRPRRTTSD